MLNLHRTVMAAIALGLGTWIATAEEKPNKKADTTPVTDAEFVKKAASGGMFEVESSKLAKDFATNADVKKFAEKMIEDHGKANAELKEAAKRAGLEVSEMMADEHKKLLEKVKGAKGSSFDSAYLESQVTAHDEAVTLFENAAKNLKDPGLKAFAEKTLPVIKEHHEHVKKHAKDGTEKSGKDR